jgi:hypothetical protein
MSNTSKRLERQIQIINVEISAMKPPGVIAAAIRMRDDLRKVIENLEGAQKELEQAESNIR